MRSLSGWSSRSLIGSSLIAAEDLVKVGNGEPHFFCLEECFFRRREDSRTGGPSFLFTQEHGRVAFPEELFAVRPRPTPSP